jgi:Fic family protein
MDVPGFQEYLKQELAERGVKQSGNPQLGLQISQELENSLTGMTASQLATKLNSTYQNVTRALHSLINNEIIVAVPINGNTNKFVINPNRGIVIRPLPDLL